MGSCLSCFYHVFGRSNYQVGPTVELLSSDGSQDHPPAATAVPIKMDGFMSSPDVRIEESEGRAIAGHGLALAGCELERGAAAYWEWHIGDIQSTDGEVERCMFGVSTKRNPDFYKILAKSDGAASSLKLATKLMRPLQTKPGDTVGVALDLTPEKPYAQLHLNGELHEEFFLGRFRGSVYPSIWLPPPDGSTSALFVHNEAQFNQVSPHARFLPLSVDNASKRDEIV